MMSAANGRAGSKFEDPIPLPDGQILIAVREPASYTPTLSEKKADLPDWQVAIEALMLCSRNGPPMLAHIAVMRALNRNVERAFNPDGKGHHWGKRKLKRDQ